MASLTDNYLRARLPSPNAPFTDPLGRATGESLDPLRFTSDELMHKRSVIKERAFAALWQQDPRIEGGGYLGRADFYPDGQEPRVLDPKVFEHRTAGIHWCRGYDFAFSEKERGKADPDFTASCLMGWRWAIGGEWYDVYIKHIILWQETWTETKRQIARIAAEDGEDVWISGEGNGTQKAAMNDLEMYADLANYRKVLIPMQVADKTAKALPWIDHAKRGYVWLEKSPWNRIFFDQIEAFPNGAHDDMHDAISMAWRLCMFRGVETSPEVQVGHITLGRSWR